MKIFLINTPDYEKPINKDMAGGLGFDRSKSTLLPPLELLSFATSLLEKDHEVILLDAQIELMNYDQIREWVLQFGPEVLILTVSLPYLSKDIEFIKKMKNDLSDSCQIVCKTAISYQPIVEKILHDSGCNYCIIGECDLIIDQILAGKSRQGTARLTGGKYDHEEEVLLDDLDLIPIFNRKLLRNDAYYYSTLGAKTTTMQTSRGCSFKCGYYCPYPLVQGSKWRSMSAARIFQEVQNIIKEEQITNIFFRDATFTFNMNRIKELCRLIIRKSLKFSWWCETRVNLLNNELLDLMKESGCKGLNIGVETGDENLLTERAKQGVTLSDIVQITDHCKAIGIKLRFLLMIGLPGETKQSLYNTFKLIKMAKPDYIGVTTVTPYPGTQFYEDAVRNNWIKNPDINTFGGHGYNVEIDSLTSEDLGFAMNKFYEIHRVTREKEIDELAISHVENEFLTWSENCLV